MKKRKDIVECRLEPHKFHLVEDECLKEVRSKWKIIKIASSSSSTTSSRLKKVTVTKTKPKPKDKVSSNKKKCLSVLTRRSSRRKVLESPRSALVETESFKNSDLVIEEAVENEVENSIIAEKEAESEEQKKGGSSSTDVGEKEGEERSSVEIGQQGVSTGAKNNCQDEILVRNLLNVSLQDQEERDPNVVGRTDEAASVCEENIVSPPSLVEDVSESPEPDSTVLVDKTPNWTLIHSTLRSGGVTETPLGDELEVEEEEVVVADNTINVETSNMEGVNNTVDVEFENNNMEEENNTVEVENQKNSMYMEVETENNTDVENNTLDAETERNNVEIEISTIEDLPLDTSTSSPPPPQVQSEGPGLASITEKSPPFPSTPAAPSPNQVRVNCECEGCLRPNCRTCKTCKKIRKLACNTATKGLRCEARSSCWGFSVPQVQLNMGQVRLERLRHQAGCKTTQTLNNNNDKIADKEEGCFEDLVEIVEDIIVPLDVSIGSDEEILSVEVVTQPAAQPQSPQRKTTKIRDLQNDAVVPEPKKLIEFDMFSSVDKDLERKMGSDQSRKLKRKKNKEPKTKKSRKVADHRGEKKKSKLQSQVESEGKVMPETRSDDKVNIIIKVLICSFLTRLLTQDIGPEVTRMIEEEMKKYGGD